MAQQNRTTLKGYFETGDVPTEAQFIDVFDSMHIAADDGAVQVQPSEGAFADGDKTKLDGIATGATNNTGALADLDTVDTAQIDDGAITTAKVQNGTLLFADIADIPTDSFVGRNTAGSGILEVLTPAEALTLLALDSSTNGEGASQIAIEDAGDFTAETDVEGALQEIYGELDNHGDIVTFDQTAFVKVGEREVIIFDAGGSVSAARPTQSSSKMVIWFNHTAEPPTNMGAYDMAIGAGFGVALTRTETGTTYTLVLADAGRRIDCTNASAVTVTIPANSSVAYVTGTEITINQLGAGTVTVEGDTGVTLNGVSAGSGDIDAQYAGVTIRKTATDTWVMQGAHGTVA